MGEDYLSVLKEAFEIGGLTFMKIKGNEAVLILQALMERIRIF